MGEGLPVLRGHELAPEAAARRTMAKGTVSKKGLSTGEGRRSSGKKYAVGRGASGVSFLRLQEKGTRPDVLRRGVRERKQKNLGSGTRLVRPEVLESSQHVL